MSIETALDFLASEEGQRITKKYKRNKKKKEINGFVKSCAKEIIIPVITSVLTTIVVNFLCQ